MPSYLITQDDLGKVNQFLTSNKSKAAKDYLNKVIVLWDERDPPSAEMPDRAEDETVPTCCQWRDCDQPGGRRTLRGIRLCTFHYSQAASSGRVEVVA